jgi:hypothetical protein
MNSERLTRANVPSATIVEQSHVPPVFLPEMPTQGPNVREADMNSIIYLVGLVVVVVAVLSFFGLH